MDDTNAAAYSSLRLFSVVLCVQLITAAALASNDGVDGCSGPDHDSWLQAAVTVRAWATLAERYESLFGFYPQLPASPVGAALPAFAVLAAEPTGEFLTNRQITGDLRVDLNPWTDLPAVLPLVDPWGHPYYIASTADATIVWCLGADGALDDEWFSTNVPFNSACDVVYVGGAFVHHPCGFCCLFDSSHEAFYVSATFLNGVSPWNVAAQPVVRADARP